MNAPYHHKALPPGTQIREWVLEDVLGAGGFAIVYKGRGVYFGETVAIKEYFPSGITERLDGLTVTPSDSSSEETYTYGMQKFVDEARILWNLSRPERHPNLVCVRSLFESHGTAYMVMDFEDGVPLSRLLRAGRSFDEATLLDLIRPVAEGLSRAHRAGVFHRDIKPANILVNPGDKPVLIDFGSARFEVNQGTNTRLTFYTPPYAALEQYVRTYQQGPWTDIYALGVTLYQCITGSKPAEALERAHSDGGKRLSEQHWPGFSEQFLAAVDSAMEIWPQNRPKTLEEWLTQFPDPASAIRLDTLRLPEAALPEEAEPDDRDRTSYMAPPKPETADSPAGHPEESPARGFEAVQAAPAADEPPVVADPEPVHAPEVEAATEAAQTMQADQADATRIAAQSVPPEKAVEAAAPEPAAASGQPAENAQPVPPEPAAKAEPAPLQPAVSPESASHKVAKPAPAAPKGTTTKAPSLKAPSPKPASAKPATGEKPAAKIPWLVVGAGALAVAAGVALLLPKSPPAAPPASQPATAAPKVPTAADTLAALDTELDAAKAALQQLDSIAGQGLPLDQQEQIEQIRAEMADALAQMTQLRATAAAAPTPDAVQAARDRFAQLAAQVRTASEQAQALAKPAEGDAAGEPEDLASVQAAVRDVLDRGDRLRRAVDKDKRQFAQLMADGDRATASALGEKMQSASKNVDAAYARLQQLAQSTAGATDLATAAALRDQAAATYRAMLGDARFVGRSLIDVRKQHDSAKEQSAQLAAARSEFDAAAGQARRKLESCSTAATELASGDLRAVCDGRQQRLTQLAASAARASSADELRRSSAEVLAIGPSVDEAVNAARTRAQAPKATSPLTASDKRVLRDMFRKVSDQRSSLKTDYNKLRKTVEAAYAKASPGDPRVKQLSDSMAHIFASIEQLFKYADAVESAKSMEAGRKAAADFAALAASTDTEIKATLRAAQPMTGGSSQ